MTTNTLVRTPEAKFRLATALAYLEAHLEEWDQGEWRCETGKCLFGTYVDLHPDLEWDHPTMPRIRDRRTGDTTGILGTVAFDLGLAKDVFHSGYYDSDRGWVYDARNLSHAGNTMEDLRRMVGEYINDQPLTLVDHEDDFYDGHFYDDEEDDNA